MKFSPRGEVRRHASARLYLRMTSAAVIFAATSVSYLAVARAQQGTPLPPVPVEPAPKAAPKAQAKQAPATKRPQAARRTPPRVRRAQTPPPQPAPAPAPVAEPLPVAGPAGVIVDPGQPVIATTAGPVQGYRALSATSGTRSDTPVERVPQSIAVLPRTVIEDQRTNTVGETLRNVAGIAVQSDLWTPAFESTRLRGFLVDRWVDGLSALYNPGDRSGQINIERIEVLKGPSGFLYGGGIGNPVGGAINIVSKLPTDTPSALAGITFGSHKHFQPFFDINQPITPNVLFRITGEYTYAESHIDVIETQRYNINPTITFTDRHWTTLTVQGTVKNWRQPEYQGLPATGTVTGGFRLPRDMFLGPANIPDSYSQYHGLTVTFDHKLNPVWSFNVKGRLAQSKFEENVQAIVGGDGFGADVPFIPPSVWGLYNAELYQEQQEGTLTGHALAKFNLGPTQNKFMIGGDYSRVRDEGFINSAFAGFVDLLNPIWFPYTDPGPRIKDQIVINTTSGIFTQLQTTIWDRLHFTAGVRAANVKIDYSDTTFGIGALTDTTRVLPRVGAVVDVLPGISLFAGYSEGMRGQPFLSFAGTPEPELSDQVEGGIKFNFGGRLAGTLSVYEVNRTNVATTDPFTLQSIANGEQRARGFEADATWQISPALRLLASYAYTDAEYAKDVPATLFAPGIAAGTRIPGVAEHSGRVWLNYEFQEQLLKGFSIGGGIYMASDALISTSNPFTTDGYFTIDAKVAYKAERFEAAVAVKNLTGEKYFEPYGYFNGRVVPSDAVTAYGTLIVRY